METVQHLIHRSQSRSFSGLPRSVWSIATAGNPVLLSPLARFGFALLFGVAALAIRLGLYHVMGMDTPILISIVAVALAARLGGFGPGAVATAVGFFGGVALLVPPIGTQPIPNAAQDLRLLLFLATGLTVSGLTEALNQTTSAWLRAEQEQENRVLQERNRMAREIHDTLAQGLTGIIIQLEAAEDVMSESLTSGDADVARQHIARAQELAKFSLTEARRSVQALRPLALEDRDLVGALSHSVEQMTAGTGVRAAVHVVGVLPIFVTGDMQNELLRIGVEAATNAIKHARADHIWLGLTFTPELASLSVKDDGRGFAPHGPQSGSGFGVTGMWERAERIGAEFTLVSNHGAGTEVKVTLSAPAASASRVEAWR